MTKSARTILVRTYTKGQATRYIELARSSVGEWSVTDVMTSASASTVARVRVLDTKDPTLASALVCDRGELLESLGWRRVRETELLV